MTLLQITTEISTQGAEHLAAAGGWLDKVKGMAIDFAPKLLGAIAVYIIGNWLINKVHGLLIRVMAKRNMEVSLQRFLGSLFKVSMLILLLLSVIGMLGVNITSFAALLAGAGLAIGAALNGSLGNLAGGVMLLLFKPFKIGDIIESQGSTGVVQEIGIFNTVILTPDNKTVILPNGALSTNTITNFNTHGNLRVDLRMNVSPDTDIAKAKAIATQTMLSHPTVLASPAPEVNIFEVANGCVTLAIRPYTTQTDYWDVYFGVTEKVKKAFDENGIVLATPTHVVINKNA